MLHRMFNSGYYRPDPGLTMHKTSLHWK